VACTHWLRRKRRDQGSRRCSVRRGRLGDFALNDGPSKVIFVPAQVEDLGIEPMSLLLGKAEDLQVAVGDTLL
jgi:hypothetical protein